MVDETPLFAIVHCHPRPCCFPGLRSVACLQKVYGSRDPGQPTASNTAPRHPTTSTCTLHLPRHQTPQHRIIASSLSLVPRVLTLHDSQRDRRLAITPHSNQSFQQTSWNHLPIQLHLASTLTGSQAQTLSFYHLDIIHKAYYILHYFILFEFRRNWFRYVRTSPRWGPRPCTCQPAPAPHPV